MTYTIIEVKQIDVDTIHTIVNMELNGFTKLIEIAHFRPRTTSEIDSNIKVRAISEQNSYDYQPVAQDVINKLVIGTPVNF